MSKIGYCIDERGPTMNISPEHGLRAKEVVPAKPCDQDHNNPRTHASFGRCVKCGATVRDE